MSKYRQILTEYKNGDSLVKALADLKVEHSRAANLRENGVTLTTHWSGTWGGRDQRVAIAVDRDQLGRALGHRPMDGLGFAWNGSGYDLIQDQHDGWRAEDLQLLARLRQRYAFHEVTRLARAKGYSVRETPGEAGRIRLTLVRR